MTVVSVFLALKGPILALILTIVIEGAIMWFLTHSFEWVKYNFYCNIITNPLVNLFIMVTYGLFSRINDNRTRYIVAYFVPLIIGETAVYISEAMIYRYITAESKGRCVKYSVITNTVTTIVGIIYFIYKLLSGRY